VASGLSPKLPLQLDVQDGYSLNKTHIEMVGQNLKMLILTAPGERIMDPLFGVGIRNYLFEMNHSLTYEEIEVRISRQVNKYMPFLEVRTIFLGPDDVQEGDPNLMKVQIEYFIKPLRVIGALEILLEDTI
jgi:uncharacterized protein